MPSNIVWAAAHYPLDRRGPFHLTNLEKRLAHGEMIVEVGPHRASR
jgi:hypothetical protein